MAPLLLAAGRRDDPSRLEKLAGAFGGSAALWIGYLKSGPEIREAQATAAGRAAGWKSGKADAGSKTRTILKVAAPVAARRGANRAQSGMLPCFLRGMVSTLVSSIRRARITRGRVSRGSITSSM